jgi:large-conductance mechanosensitive channel
VAPPWELPRPQRRFSGVMQNALVTALVSAIVSGVISFAVAHYQSQDAAAQARNAQRITGLTQLESATAGFYQAALALYNARSECLGPAKAKPGCPPPLQDFDNANSVLEAAIANVSGRAVINLVNTLLRDSFNTVANAGRDFGADSYLQMEDAYYHVVVRCGQLIQARA